MKKILISLTFLIIAVGVMTYLNYSQVFHDYEEYRYGKTSQDFVNHRTDLWKSQKINDLDFFITSALIVKKRWPGEDVPILFIYNHIDSLPMENSLRRTVFEETFSIFSNRDSKLYNYQNAYESAFAANAYLFHLTYERDCSSKFKAKKNQNTHIIYKDAIDTLTALCNQEQNKFIYEARKYKSKSNSPAQKYIAYMLYKTVLRSPKFSKENKIEAQTFMDTM